jgi:predicted component of type VI protein secretion system
MSITVKIMRRSVDGLSLYATRDLEVLPVSIGRDAACTFVLEDPHKHISRFHVEIEEEGGTYWMAVVSKVNPVMVKGRRYGPGTRLTLHSGDSFEIAEYEVQVLLPQPAMPEPGERLFKVLSAAQTEIDDAPVPVPALAPAAEQDDAERIFNESTFFGDEALPRKKLIPRDDPPPEETFIPEKAVAAAPGSANLLRAFMEGAGVPHKELSAAESERLMRECGAVLRASVEGVMMLLLARGEMLKEFHAEDRTMVAARDNNPLKMMSDPHEAMAFLFDPTDQTGGFLDPVQAIGDACEDLRAHELALMAGMRAAILGALRRFDPPILERALEQSAKGFTLASRKARLWDLYLALYDKLARDSQEDFNKVFGRDFIGAYQAQLRRMKGGR